jgi:hypothetical protein
MRSNPYRLTLAWLGIGFLIAGVALLLMALAIPADPETGAASPNAGVLTTIGNLLLTIGFPAFVGWLVIRAIQWVPVPAKPRNTRSEEEIAAFLKAQRDPDGLA